jgi:hypothetical protein
MAGIVDTISLAMEEWVLDYFGDQSPEMHFKNWGFVELVNRGSKSRSGNVSNQPIPVTITGDGQREQVSLDDRYDYMHWIRWVSPITSVESEEDSWGLRAGKRMRLPLRIVVAHKVEIGENFILQLVNGLPENVVVPGLDFVFLNSDYSVDPDHETIYNTELGATVYEQHRFNWNIYVIDLSAEFVICIPSAVGDSSPDEDFKIFDFTFDSTFE